MLRSSFTVALLASWAGAARVNLMDHYQLRINLPENIMKEALSPAQVVAITQAATEAVTEVLENPVPEAPE